MSTPMDVEVANNADVFMETEPCLSRANEVELGRARTRLRFDSYPYPTDEPQYAGATYESEIVLVLERFLEPGDFAIDVGASVGFHTCLMAKLVGEEGLVLAFEPHAKSYEHLVKHVRANALNNVGHYKKALWRRDERELKLYSIRHLGYSSFHRYENATYSEVVEGRALDTLLLRDHPKLIKIDVEGTEPEVLLGAERILRKGVDCVILELNFFILKNTNRDDQEIRKWMHERGYDMFLISIGDGAGGFQPPVKVEPHMKLKLDGSQYINVMFSTEEKVRKRWPKIGTVMST